MRRILGIFFALSLVFAPALVLADELNDKNRAEVREESEQSATSAAKEAEKKSEDAALQIKKSENLTNLDLENSNDEKNSKDGNRDSSSTSKIKSASPRSEKALERMSETAKKVEEILTTVGAKGGIGEEVSQVAQEEKDDQEKTKDALKKIDERNGLIKFLIGANFKEVKNVRANLARLDARIKKLNELLGTITDQNLKTAASSTLSSLEQQKTALEDRVKTEESTFSLFGWFAKLFTK